MNELRKKVEELQARCNDRITKKAHARAVRDAYFVGGGRFWAESVTRAHLRACVGADVLASIEANPPDVRVGNYITAVISDLKKAQVRVRELEAEIERLKS